MKTIKHIIWMAALALTAATWSACSNVDEPTTTEQPAQARTYTLTTTLSPRDGGTRSKMEYVNETTGITAEWEENDQIWVQYDDNSLAGTAETTATVTAVDPTTKAATITVTLTDPKDDGNITFGYPLSHWNGTTDPDNDQIGTLDDINANHASIYGIGTLTVSGSDVTLVSPVTMNPEMCIWKFTFTDGTDDITSAVTKLVIDFPDNGTTYTVTPTSLSNIYVALYGDIVNNQPISITAKTATGVYRKSAASVTLAAGTTYISTAVALTSAAAANAVAGDIGKVIGADGNIYPNVDIATTFGTTATAAIAYVGSVSNYFTKFLAIAVSDANDSQLTWADALTAIGTYASAHPITIGSTTYNSSNAWTQKYDAVPSGNNSPSATASTMHQGWRLPSVTDWRYIFQGLGGPSAISPVGVTDNAVYGTWSDLRDAINRACGNTALQSAGYWSSSEYTSYSNYAWGYGFLSDDGKFWWSTKTNPWYVRPVLAY